MSGKWYQNGLAFGCVECGRCCAGPDEGYVWINKAEIEALARYLKMDVERLKKTYLRRVGIRYSLMEKQPSKDCVFLIQNGDKHLCEIYPVRPMQCRTWPFWSENLKSRQSWEDAGRKCPGINRGHWFDLENIEAIRKQEKTVSTDSDDALQKALQWIRENWNHEDCISEIEQAYAEIEQHLESLNAGCGNCGSCCDFDTYEHRLYVTTLEMLYFCKGITDTVDMISQLESVIDGGCPFQQSTGCAIRDFRPVGCRIFYCSSVPEQFQNELTEQMIKRLQSLHDTYGALYCYADLREWLKAVQAWNFSPAKKK